MAKPIAGFAGMTKGWMQGGAEKGVSSSPDGSDTILNPESRNPCSRNQCFRTNLARTRTIPAISFGLQENFGRNDRRILPQGPGLRT